MTDKELDEIIQRRNELHVVAGDGFFALCNRILNEDHPALVAEIRRMKEQMRLMAKDIIRMGGH